MARSFKCQILNVKGLYYLCSVNKGVDQPSGYHAADLFVFAYAKSRFSYDATHFICSFIAVTLCGCKLDSNTEQCMSSLIVRYSIEVFLPENQNLCQLLLQMHTLLTDDT